MAGLIEAELRQVGFDKPAFDTIVASGPNSAVPHRDCDRRWLGRGLVVLDFGGMLDGYAVDLTRTITVGRRRDGHGGCSKKWWPLSRRPLRNRKRPAGHCGGRRGAERAGAGGLRRGVQSRDWRRVGPRNARTSAGSRCRADLEVERWKAGMVFTFEPGAYLSRTGAACRIEDDVVVTADGAEWLTDVPRLL